MVYFVSMKSSVKGGGQTMNVSNRLMMVLAGLAVLSTGTWAIGAEPLTTADAPARAANMLAWTWQPDFNLPLEHHTRPSCESIARQAAMTDPGGRPNPYLDPVESRRRYDSTLARCHAERGVEAEALPSRPIPPSGEIADVDQETVEQADAQCRREASNASMEVGGVPTPYIDQTRMDARYRATFNRCMMRKGAEANQAARDAAVETATAPAGNAARETATESGTQAAGANQAPRNAAGKTASEPAAAAAAALAKPPPRQTQP